MCGCDVVLLRRCVMLRCIAAVLHCVGVALCCCVVVLCCALWRCVVVAV